MFPLAKRAKTHPDIRLPIRVIADLDMRWVVDTLPQGSEIRIFGPLVKGRHRTNYRRLHSPFSPLHGCFVAESINGIKLVEILGEDRDLVTD